MEFEKAQIVFFDGVCNLCNGYVDFLIRRDKARIFHVASLQGETARQLLAKEDRSLSTVILFQNGRIFKKSTAVLAILSQLPFPWRLTKILFLVPRVLRDFFYDLVACARYRIFGRRDFCRLPTPEEQKYFLD